MAMPASREMTAGCRSPRPSGASRAARWSCASAAGARACRTPPWLSTTGCRLRPSLAAPSTRTALSIPRGSAGTILRPSPQRLPPGSPVQAVWPAKIAAAGQAAPRILLRARSHALLRSSVRRHAERDEPWAGFTTAAPPRRRPVHRLIREADLVILRAVAPGTPGLARGPSGRRSSTSPTRHQMRAGSRLMSRGGARHERCHGPVIGKGPRSSMRSSALRDPAPGTASEPASACAGRGYSLNRSTLIRITASPVRFSAQWSTSVLSVITSPGW